MIRKFIFLLLTLSVLLSASSCANVGRFNRVIDPQKVNKKDLESLPVVKTPVYEFRLTAEHGLNGKLDSLTANVDEQFAEFSECYEISDNGDRAREFLIAVVEGTFECKFHNGRCNGEYDPDNKLIVVTYKAFNRKGTMPLLKHEWAHAYKILDSDHENLEEVQKCTVY